MSITSEAKQEVERLLRTGQKIQAIKYIQDTFDVSLTEAKTLVEAVERETSQSSNDQSFPPQSSSLKADLVSEVERLLRENRKLEAVKYVRTNTHKGLREALSFVEDVERRVNPNFSPSQMTRGCTGVFKTISIIFGFIGIIFLIIAGVFFYLQQRIISNGELMTGRVIELRTNDDQMFAPVIAYQWQGEEKIYVDNMYSNPPGYEVGEEVSIYVNREDPSEIVIDSFTDRWLFILIFGGIGVVFTSIMILSIFIGRKF